MPTLKFLITTHTFEFLKLLNLFYTLLNLFKTLLSMKRIELTIIGNSSNLTAYAKTLFISFFVSVMPIISQAQGTCPSFMMQGFNYDFGKYAQGYNWADTLRLKADCIGKAGFTHLWFPGHYGNGPYSSGYNPRDIYMGENTGLGTPAGIRSMINALNAAGVDPVGDMIYNHRDAGRPEKNPAVEEYIQYRAGGSQKPYPADRYHVVIPLGGTSSNGAGDYYVNINSRTQTYSGSKYMFYATTNKIGGSRWSPILTPQVTTVEQAGFYTVDLGRNYETTIDNNGDSDEFKVTINTADFNAAGDQLIIYMVNTNGYADQRVWKVWSSARSIDLVGKSGGTGPSNVTNVFSDEVEYHTYTDFSAMPSGLGSMNWTNFRPNYNSIMTGTSGNWNIECLCPDFSMRSKDYFYDFDHLVPDTRDKLIDWTEWNFTKTVGGSSPLGIKGMRMDAVKHFDPSFVPAMLNRLHTDGIIPTMVVGEYYGNNRTDLQGWVQSVYNNGFNAAVPIQMHPRVFDFHLRDALRNALNNRLSTDDFRYIYDAGLVGGNFLSGNNVATFLNNHDFRHNYEANHGESLVHYDAMLGYAYLLTNNQLGVPTVYYDDYFGYPPASSPLYQSYFPTTLSPMKCEIDALMALHKKYIFGSPSVAYLNKSGSGFSANYISSEAKKSLIYQLNAPSATNKRVIVAINFSNNTLKVDHQIAGTAIAGTRFTDMLRRSAFPSAIVNGSGQIYMEVPPLSYSVWVEGDDEPIVPKPTITTTPAAVEIASVLTTTVCAGDNVNLMGSFVANTTTCASMAKTPEVTYNWTGPNGFTSTAQNPVVSNMTAAKAGDYKLTLKYDCAACTSSEVLVKILLDNTPPSVGGSISGTTTITSGTNTTLTLNSHTGTILRWESSLNNFATTPSTINHTNAVFTTPNLTATTSYRAVVQSGTCSFAYSTPVTVTVNTPLPVELINFQAQNKGKTNLLTWQTASEKDNEGFYIERSSDGKSFETIGFVKGQGTTLKQQSYNFTDNDPLSISYYKLRQRDFNGKESFSQVKLVARTSKNYYQVSPNPASNIVNVLLHADKEQIIEFELVNTIGQIVHSQRLNSQIGDNQLTINVRNFPKGQYLLRVKQGGTIGVEKIIIE
jgi:hypothetical protein